MIVFVVLLGSFTLPFSDFQALYVFESNPNTIKIGRSSERAHRDECVHGLLKHQKPVASNWSTHKQLFHTPIVQTGLWILSA